MAGTDHLAAHPDENLLAAFAERALTPRDREFVLEHLSTCARCRDVVFLVQQAFSETGAQAATSQPSPRRERRSWWALAGAGALAALLVAVSVVLYRQHGDMSKQAALPAPPMQRSAPAGGTAPPEPQRAKTIEDEPKQPGLPHALKALSERAGSGGIAGSVTDRSGAVVPGASVSVKALQSGKTQTAVTDQSGQFDMASLPSGAYQVDVQAPGFRQFSQAIKVQPSERAKLEAKLDVGAASQTVAVTASPDAGPLPTTRRGLGVIGGLGAGHANSGSTGSAQNTAPAAAPQAPQQQATVSAEQSLLDAAAPSSGSALVISAPSAIPIFRVKDGSVERCIGPDCVPRSLPFGARAVSATGSGETVLAVDSEGNLFLSDDEGEHWEQAKAQWQGKAVSVALQLVQGKAAKLYAAPKASAARVDGTPVMKAHAPVVPLTFELTNDKGQVWVSSDGGKTWVAK